MDPIGTMHTLYSLRIYSCYPRLEAYSASRGAATVRRRQQRSSSARAVAEKGGIKPARENKPWPEGTVCLCRAMLE